MGGAHSRGRDRVGPEATPGLGAAQRCTTSPRGLKTSVPPSSLPSQAALPSSPWFPVIQKDQDSALCSFSTPTTPPLQRLPGDTELTR